MVENSPDGEDESLHLAEFQVNSLLEKHGNNLNNNNNHNTRYNTYSE